MTYKKESNEWLLIRANAGTWFSDSNMKFWGSRIYWNSLTKVGDKWLFISSEDNWDKSRKMFSIRSVDAEWNLDTVSFQEHELLEEAKRDLKRIQEGQGF